MTRNFTSYDGAVSVVVNPEVPHSRPTDVHPTVSITLHKGRTQIAGSSPSRPE